MQRGYVMVVRWNVVNLFIYLFIYLFIAMFWTPNTTWRQHWLAYIFF